MAEPVVLYVDELNPDETIGLTKDANIIAYNNIKIDEYLKEDLVNEFTNVLISEHAAAHISHIGRYICMANISLEKKSYGMFFVDIKDDVPEALFMANKLDFQESKDEFMRIFYQLRKVYKNNYKKAKLIKGKPTVQS